MLLYHGTAETSVSQILSGGVKPRQYTNKSNWEHSIPSCKKNVYLTTAYAPYYAYCATSEPTSDKWAIIEVDSDKLKLSNMRPDEDYIIQAAQSCNDVEEGTLAHLLQSPEYRDKAQAWVVKNVDRYSDFWEDSVEHLGTCSHKGVIPVESITRVAVFNPSEYPDIFRLVDPLITISNYRFCGSQYRAITRRLMGDEVDPRDVGFMNREVASAYKELYSEGYTNLIEFINSLKSVLVYMKSDCTSGE